MWIRANVPFGGYFLGPDERTVQPSTRFACSGYEVEVSFSGVEPITFDTLPQEYRFARYVGNIVLTFRDGPEEQGTLTLEQLAHPDERPTVMRLLVLAANRVLSALRNFGAVTYIKEAEYLDGEEESLLRNWKVESSQNGATWVNFVPPLEGLAGVLLSQSARTSLVPEFKAAHWAEVEEAIQDNLQPGPEHEFLVNTIEHLHTKNYRLALLEATVCLEIVTSQFLEQYLGKVRKFSRTKIGNLLTSQVGLSARIGLLIDMALTQDERRKVELDGVLIAIGWRNKIVHKTGHLPEDLPEDEIKDRIMSVLYLSHLLSTKRDQLAATPEANQIAEALEERLGVERPTITPAPRHRWVVEFQFDLNDEFPSRERLEEIAAEVAHLLRERDNRFQPETSLFIRFVQVLSPVAVFVAGTLKFLKEPLRPLRLPPLPARED